MIANKHNGNTIMSNTHPKPKLPTPENLSVNPSTMESTSDFGTAKKHSVHIVDSAKNVIVRHAEIECGPAGGKIAINIITLPHEGPYVAGKYTLSLKSIASKDEAHSNSEPAKVEFDMTPELAAVANSRLNRKQILELEAAFEKVAKEHGDKLKLFPDLPQTIKDLKGLTEKGNTHLAEFEVLNKQLKKALTELDAFKSERSGIIQELREALEKVAKIKPAKQAGGTEKTAAKSSIDKSEALAALVVTAFAGLFILGLFVLAVVAIAQHGPIAETKALFPNGVNNAVQAPAPVVTPPPATPAIPPAAQPSAASITPPIQPAVSQDESEHRTGYSSMRVVCVPPHGHEYDGTWSDQIQPGEIVKYNYRPGFIVTQVFDTSTMHGHYNKVDLARSTPQLGAVEGITMLLRPGINEAQPITFQITPVN